MKYSHIIIEGNIGAGKTTVSKMLAKQFNANLILEEFEENDFLPKFYENKERFAFSVELSFLADRYHQLTRKLEKDKLTIGDYYIVKSLIFAEVTLDKEEYLLYKRIYDIMHEKTKRPELLVYLDLPTEKLLEQIKMRGRSYELDIKSDYLEKIKEGYFSFFNTQKELTVVVLNCENVDLVGNAQHYSKFLEILNTTYLIGTHFIDFNKA